MTRDNISNRTYESLLITSYVIFSYLHINKSAISIHNTIHVRSY